MNRTEIEEKVRDFLVEDLEIDEEKIYPQAKLKEDMGIDSLDLVDIVVIVEKNLDLVDIVVIVEKNFGFKLKAEEMAGVDTYGQFCDYIERKVKK